MNHLDDVSFGIIHHGRACIMGKGNNAQKNDKKNKKPKQDKSKAAPKK